VRGPRNRRAPPAVWQAVHAWIAEQSLQVIDISSTSAQATREAFRRFWEPYVGAAEGAGLPPHVLARVLGRDTRRAKPNALAPIPIERVPDREMRGERRITAAPERAAGPQPTTARRARAGG
jgi:hypothetical protein